VARNTTRPLVAVCNLNATAETYGAFHFRLGVDVRFSEVRCTAAHFATSSLRLGKPCTLIF